MTSSSITIYMTVPCIYGIHTFYSYAGRCVIPSAGTGLITMIAKLLLFSTFFGYWSFWITFVHQITFKNGRRNPTKSGDIWTVDRICFWSRTFLYLPRISITMMTSSNGNSFRVTGPLCGEFTGPGEFPTQRPVTRSFDVLFDLCLNKRLSK